MSQANRPILALVLLALAIALAVIAVALPVARALELRRSLDSGQEQLDALRRASSDGKGLAEFSSAQLLVPGETTGQAAAEMQRKVRIAAQTFNATIRTMHPQVLRARRDGDFTAISLDVNLQAATVGLRDLVHQLETSVPLLIIDEINIRASPVAPESGARAIQLDVGMKLRGFAAAREQP